MKSIRSSLLLYLCFLGFQLQSQINTTTNRYIGCTPDSFKFYTLGNTHSGQLWNSGNGSNTTIDSPVFVYSTPGTYIVTIGSLSRTITIYPKLSFDFKTDSARTGCFPFSFNLIDNTVYPAGVTPTFTQWIYQNGGTKIGSPAVDVIPSYYLHHCYVTMQVSTNIPSCYGDIRKDSFFKILDRPQAKIDLSPKAGCKVPFSPTILNKSKDSLRTTLTYLWNWDLPSPGSSTNLTPPPLIFTTNALATITLEARNQYGCVGKDTVKFKLDTPVLDYTASSKICRAPFFGKIFISNLDTANFTYEFNSQKRISGSNIFNLESAIKDTTLFSGFYADNPFIDTFAYIFLTKRSKLDTSCKTTVSKKVSICQTYPMPELRFSKNCGPPFRDTIIAHRWTSCWDTIRYQMFYTDKYGFMIRMDSFNVKSPTNIKRTGPDTIIPYGLDRLLKTDSFYRRGPLTLHTIIGFINAETKCTHTFADWFRGLQTSLFRPHLINYYNQGCVGRKDSFKIFTQGAGGIDSVIWVLGDGTIIRNKSSELEYTYLSAGKFKTYAIVKNTQGCIDTVNPVFTYRGDSIIPTLTISNINICASETTNLSITNSSFFDRWYFVTDNAKSFNCFDNISFDRSNFYHTGKQYVYLMAEKMGCQTQTMDSIYVSGPKFNLNYDFKCSRKDSIMFYVTDTADIQTKINWNFGDGTVYDTLKDTIWHKFVGDSVDYNIMLYSENANGCRYGDTAVVKIRNVQAMFHDTMFCKMTNPTVFLNGTPYVFNPSQSKNADMNMGYRYTWQLESIPKPGFPAKKYPPYTSTDSILVHIWEDTMNLTLIARDINGCEDKITKRIIVTDNTIDFNMNYSDSCPTIQLVNLNNLSSSPFGIATSTWNIYSIKNGLEALIMISTSFNSAFVADANIADSFRIQLEIKDNKNCNVKTMSKIFSFVRDTSNLIVPDTTCQELTHNIKSTENDPLKFKYRWYVNNVLIPDDTTYQLDYKFVNIGRQVVKLEKMRRQTGCTKTFIDSTTVVPKPRLRIDNSFRLSLNKCFPANTTISYFDSANIPSLSFKFVHNGSPRTLNPTTIDLDKGPNLIEAVFWTDHGCSLTIPVRDTVYGPSANLSLDKKAICKNDSITFTLTNPQDVDSVLWTFGDGTILEGKSLQVGHKYTTANIASDTMPVGFIVYAPNKSCPFAKTDKVLVYETISSHHINNKIDTAFCLGPFMIHNTAPKADYFRWSVSNGDTFSSNQASFIYTIRQAGAYQIKQYAFRNPLGCIDSSTSNVVLYPKPALSATIDTTCLGAKTDILFKVDLPSTKIYLRPDTFMGSPYSISPIKTQISKTTSFTLIGISSQGCTDSIQAIAPVLFPKFEKSWDTIVEVGKKIVLPVGYDPKWTYTWSPKWVNSSCFNCANPELQIFDSIQYNLTLEDYKKCFKNTYKYVIRIYPDILIKLPTAFTPNGDGNNDIIYAKGFGIKKLLTLKIFNRQGQLLFVSNDEKFGWDGYYNGIAQNSDVYFYTYEAESFIPGKIVRGEGNFMLIK